MPQGSTFNDQASLFGTIRKRVIIEEGGVQRFVSIGVCVGLMAGWFASVIEDSEAFIQPLQRKE